MFKWDGVSSKTIDSIKIRYKQDIKDRDYQYTYDAFSGGYKWKWVTITRTHIEEYTYKYYDNKLELVKENKYTI